MFASCLPRHHMEDAWLMCSCCELPHLFLTSIYLEIKGKQQENDGRLHA